MLVPAAPKAQAQGAARAQELAALAQQLNLVPAQKTQLMPILEADARKREAIKNNTCMGPLQKMEQFKAIHAQSDPQIKAILNPQQNEQLQQIRQKEIRRCNGEDAPAAGCDACCAVILLRSPLSTSVFARP